MPRPNASVCSSIDSIPPFAASKCIDSSSLVFGGLAELHGVGALLNSLHLFLLHEVEESLDFVGRIFSNGLRAQDKREPLLVFHHPVCEAGGIHPTPFYT
jgi:hypothetical protein